METAPSPTPTRPHAPDRIRIVSTPGTCGGRPRIDGHRINVEDVVIWHLRLGMSPDAIIATYPTINLAEVHAALAYYFENRAQVDAEILENERFVAEFRAKHGSGPLGELPEARNEDAAHDPLPSR